MLPVLRWAYIALIIQLLRKEFSKSEMTNFLIRRYPFVILHLLTTFLFSPLAVQKLFIFNEHWIIHI